MGFSRVLFLQKFLRLHNATCQPMPCHDVALCGVVTSIEGIIMHSIILFCILSFQRIASSGCRQKLQPWSNINVFARSSESWVSGISFIGTMSRCWPGLTPGGGSKGAAISCFSSCGWLQLFLTPDGFTPIPASMVTPSSLQCVSHLLLPLSYRETLMIEFRAHPGHPSSSPQLSILDLITSAKTLFPYQVTFIGPRD